MSNKMRQFLCILAEKVCKESDMTYTYVSVLTKHINGEFRDNDEYLR